MPLTDYLRASDGNGESVRCIVVDPRGIGDTAFNNTTPTNWPNTFVAMVGTVNTITDRFEDGYLVFKGHLEGSVIRIDEFAPGYTDTGSPANDIIVIKPTTLWADIVADVAEQAATDAADALAGVTGKLDEDFTLLTPKTTPVDGDLFPINDSEDSYTAKSITFADLWDWVKSKIQTISSLTGFSFFLDEDDMSSNSATKVPSQQSVKAYVDSNHNDTDWQDFSWFSTTYDKSNRGYTPNKWRVKDDVLYIEVGAMASSTISTTAEDELARIPITGGITTGSNGRVWNGAVGGGGAVYGMMVTQNTNYMSVNLKPHTTANNHTADWFSTHFAIPLNEGYQITS